MNGDSEGKKIYGWALILIEQGKPTLKWVSVGKPIFVRPNHYRTMSLEGEIEEVSTGHKLVLKPIDDEGDWNAFCLTGKIEYGETEL